METILFVLAQILTLFDFGKIATVETERLILRPFQIQDLLELYPIYSNPSVMAYIGKGPRNLWECFQELIGFINHWQKHGFGPMAVVEKSTGKVIGRSGLYYRQDRSPFPQLGYVLDLPSQGQGLGTEVAKASLAYGFNYLQFSQIEAYARVENESSIKILTEKLRMELVTDCLENSGRVYAQFSLSAPQYLEQSLKRELATV